MQLPKIISANILLQVDLVQIAKFNDGQYFWIYSSCRKSQHHRMCEFMQEMSNSQKRNIMMQAAMKSEVWAIATKVMDLFETGVPLIKSSVASS